MRFGVFLIKNGTRWGEIIWNAEYNPGLQGSVRHATFKLVSFKNGK
jgi:hypothetical protein